MPSTPIIDYTNKDYQSLRQAMLALAHHRLPEWTDQSPADLGMVLVDLFAYMGDVVLYYQDRIANESFLQTAVERRSVLNALRLVGYGLAPPTAASAELTLFFKPPTLGGATIVTVPGGAQFTSVATAEIGPQIFEYLGADLDIDLASDQVVPTANGKLAYIGLPVMQSAVQPTAVIGSSTGEPNQSFALPSTPVILDTLVVEVNEGAGWVTWRRVDSLLYETASDGGLTLSRAEDRDYYVEFDEADIARVCFGDGTYGRVPPTATNNIRATWHVGGGSAGNVPANTITTLKTAVPRLAAVSNPAAAAGGTDHEDINHAKSFGPLAFRSGQRAVTLNDYVALAQQAGGVAKVRASAPTWNTIELYVAPAGDVATTVPEALRRRLIAYFEDKRMAGTFVEILDATYIPIDVGIEIVYDKRYQMAAVRQAAEAAVQGLLAFANVDFGRPLYLSDVYGTVEAVAGVTAMTVTRFRRGDSPTTQFTDQEIAAAAAFLPIQPQGRQIDVAALLRRAIQIDVAQDGRIILQDFEIPVLGGLTVDLLEAAQ
ncbi:putative baseplate assembly protein [Nitrospirillum iridis]|uniref:Putative phage protein gp47/JayE n=1 Tax=Nitrospirillum iridis TaxID=765888 RepID=A0A7X0AZU3_9PROT|nr:putative baseplate assembly protein [Nitrospirillum iridis]MBB6253159.1 putative phage protein gp47/JayE [Nitrospirillum iridis]